MITPTVGRVVWFWPSKGLQDPVGAAKHFVYKDASRPCAGIVAFVWSDDCVNLLVVDQEGNQHPFTSVRLIQGDEPRPEAQAFCEWMPYQKGQAAKTEQLEKKLSEG